MSPQDEKHSYKRRSILVLPSFQLKFSFYVVSWLTALFLAYPLTLYETFDWFARFLSSIPNGPSPEVINQYQKSILKYVVIFHGSLMLFVFLLTLFLSHRIAGPIYRIRKGLNALRSGDLTPIRLRASDHFKEVAEDFNQVVSSWKDRSMDLRRDLEGIQSSSKDPALQEKISNLIKKLE